MNRREFLAISGAVAGAGLIQGERAAAAEAVEFALASAPVVCNPSSTEATVAIAVTGPATGWVEYGSTAQLGQRSESSSYGFSPYDDRLLRFRIEGLAAGQKCFYRVHVRPIEFKTAYSIQRGDVLTSELYSFTTLNPAAESASFTVWNDTHENNTTLKKLIDHHLAHPADFLMWNGDITNDINDEKKIFTQYFNPAGQAFAARTPLFMGRGNHDVRGKYARKLPDYLAGPNDEYFYTFRQGPLGVIVMDTGEDKPDSTPVYAGLNQFAEYRSMQRKWLERAIEDPAFRSAPYRIAFLHIPLVWEAEVPEGFVKTYGPEIKGWICEDGREKWEELLVKAGVQLVISGHTHKHAFFPAREKRPYAQLIGGGPRPADARILTGKAAPDALVINMSDLDGKPILSERFMPHKQSA